MADIGRSSIEDDFMYGSNVASCHVHIRMRKLNIFKKLNRLKYFFFFIIEFLRKVYGIVATQLCFVALISTIMISLENVKMFFQNNPGFLLLIFLATMVSLMAVYAKRLEYPTNFALLGVFTFFESLSIGTLVSFFDKILVIQAIIITAVIVIGLTMYTFQTKRDFSAMGAGLFAFLCALLAGGIIQVIKKKKLFYLK
jgi:FtsH-binding integral membrane protein